jgi:hypothetical protein
MISDPAKPGREHEVKTSLVVRDTTAEAPRMMMPSAVD